MCNSVCSEFNVLNIPQTWQLSSWYLGVGPNTVCNYSKVQSLGDSLFQLNNTVSIHTNYLIMACYDDYLLPSANVQCN